MTFSSSLILLSTSKLETFSWLEIEGEGVLMKEEDDFVRSGVEIERPLSRDVVMLRLLLIQIKIG